MDENRLDDILYQACKENRESLLSFGPDFSNIEKEALLKLRKRKTARRRRAWLRTAASVAAVFLFINLFFIFADFEPVKAYRAQVRMLFFNLLSNNTSGDFEAEIVRTSNEIAKAQKTVPYHIPVPGWIPEGFKFGDVRAVASGNNDYKVTIQYKNNEDIIRVDFENESSISATVPAKGEGGFEKIKVNDMTVYLTSFSRDNGERIQCYYINNQGLNIRISGNMDKQSLEKFIEEMK